MKRLFILVLVLVLLPLTALAVEPINLARTNPYVAGAGVAAAGATCASGTKDTQSHETGSSQSTSTLRGQSFQLASTGYIYSIKLYMYAANSSLSDELTLCIDDNANMGSDGTCANAIVCATATQTSSAPDIAWYEFVFQDTDHQFLADTTYYLALRSADAIELGWMYSTDDSYAQGIEYATTAADCDLTGHQDAGYDFQFQVYLCD